MITAATMTVGDKTLSLKLTTGALMCFEEDNSGQPFDVLLDKLITGKGGASLIVSVLVAGLNDGKGADLDEVLTLADEAGGIRTMVPLISDAINRAFAKPKAGGKPRGKVKPPAKTAETTTPDSAA